MGWSSLGPEIVAGLLAMTALLYMRRHGGGAALAELELANRVLERRINDLTAENVRLAGEVATLRARTDVALAVGPVLEALRTHEERAAERSDKHLAVLGLIADRLGAEHEAA